MSPAGDAAVPSPADTETTAAESGSATIGAAAPVELAARPSSLNRISAGSTFYPLLLAAGALALVGFQIVRTVGVTK